MGGARLDGEKGGGLAQASGCFFAALGMDPFRLPRLELYAVLFYVKEREGILRDRKKNVMSWLDWILVFIPLVVVAVIGLRSQKYVHTVADFLAAGRVAGRYVICVANGEAAMGLISLVSVWEIYYNSGLAFSFWSALTTPVVVIMGLTGYCFYRFRETRAMTMGQFLEMRYNRSFRILAAFLQSISGVVNYAIFPAVGARCLIYFIGLPLHFSVFGVRIATFPLLIFLCLPESNLLFGIVLGTAVQAEPQGTGQAY